MASNFSLMDKDLRQAARQMYMLSRPNQFSLGMLHNMLALQSRQKQVPGLHCEGLSIPRRKEAGEIRTRLFKPENPDKALPLVLYLHGGGYMIGTPEQNHRLVKALIHKRDCIVIVPDYRLSTKAPYPAGVNDCYDVLIWMKENAEELGGRSDQIIVLGDSAGGGLTAAISFMARDFGDVNIAYQLPLYPMIDDRQTSSSTNNSMPAWNSKHNKLGWELYLKDLREKGEDIPIYAAPARATNYSNLPPTTTFIGSLDLFLDETNTYVSNLEAAGIPVRYKIFEGAYHGFESIAPKAEISKQAHAFLLDAFADAVDNHFVPQS